MKDKREDFATNGFNLKFLLALLCSIRTILFSAFSIVYTRCVPWKMFLLAGHPAVNSIPPTRNEIADFAKQLAMLYIWYHVLYDRSSTRYQGYIDLTFPFRLREDTMRAENFWIFKRLSGKPKCCRLVVNSITTYDNC